MYHQIAPHRPGSPLNKWRVTPRDFARQMEHLAARGLRGTSLRSWLDGDSKGTVVLTFDDGFDALRENALPVLARLGFTATVFVVAEKLGGTNDWDIERPGDALLSVDGARTLLAAGWEIGSHGATHRALTACDDGALDRETRGSRERLEAAIGSPVTSFCYPYGAFDDRAVDAVTRAGYNAATVIRSGIATRDADPLRLRRVPVRGTETFLDFRLALTRGKSHF